MGTGENFLTARPETSPPRAVTIEESMLVSRAVARRIQAGYAEECSWCERALKYRGNEQSIRKYGRNVVIVCNIYEDRVWKDRELYHEGCYQESGNPYGDVLEAPPVEPTPPLYRAHHGPKPAARAEYQHRPDELLVDAVEIITDEI